MSKWYVNETLSLTGFFDLVNVSTLDHGGLGYFVCVCVCVGGSLVRSPSLTVFFAAMAKTVEGLGTRLRGEGAEGTSYSGLSTQVSVDYNKKLAYLLYPTQLELLAAL